MAVAANGGVYAASEPDATTIVNTPIRVGVEFEPVSLAIKKVDSRTTTGANVPGATFKATATIDGVETTLTSAENAAGLQEITFPAPGTYTVSEFAAPAGYEKSEATYTVEVADNGIASVRRSGEPAGWTEIHSLIASNANLESGVITVANEPKLLDGTGVFEATKVWDDASDQDGVRPASVTFQLYKTVAGEEPVAIEGKTIELGLDENGVALDGTTVSADGNGWTGSFDDLAATEDGKAVVYSIVETAVPEGYEASDATANGIAAASITNAHEAETIDAIGVSKVWQDNDDQDGIRPASVTVQLFADDGEAAVAELTLSEANGWSGEFASQPKYRDGGTEIVYTIAEAEAATDAAGTTTVAGNGSHDGTYTVTYVDPTEANGYAATITNAHTPETMTIEGTKTWVDDNNRDGLRPGSVTVNLLANGEKVDSVVVSKPEGDSVATWNYAFADKPAYQDGQAVVYTVTEDAVANYTTAIDGFAITNTHEPAQLDGTGTITVTKAWDDADNQDGIRPANVTVTLMAQTSGEDEATAVAAADLVAPQYRDGFAAQQTLTANADGTWPTYTWQGLYAKNDGADVTYTVVETPVDDYTATVGTAGNAYTVTNSHTPALFNGNGEITVQKIWEDGGDRDGIRPANVTVMLYKTVGGETTALSAKTFESSATWTGLPANEDGQEITYSAAETKAGDVDVVTADGVSTVEATNAATNYTGTYEVAVGDVEYQGEAGANATVTVTNTHVPATIGEDGTLTVTKNWVDDSNRDGLRPASVTFGLYKQVGGAAAVPVTDDNGNATIQVTAGAASGNSWTATTGELPAYENGQQVTYSVRELDAQNQAIEDGGAYGDAYTVSYSGDSLTVTNTHEVATRDVAVAKTWDGPALPVRVQLVADGAPVVDRYVDLTADNNWANAFEGLETNRYDAASGESVAIDYTVREVAINGEPVDSTTHGEPAVTGDMANGLQVANANIETTAITATKVWSDYDNVAQARPESVTLNLYQDRTAGDAGAAAQPVASITLDGAADENGETAAWTATFAGLDKYAADGHEYAYTVEETAVPAGYTAAVTGTQAGGYTVTNTYAPDTTAATVTFGATKELADHALGAGEFAFTLTEVDENGVPLGEALQTVRNTTPEGGDAANAVAFGAISYTAATAGTHYYQIAEVEGGNPGVTYDESVKTVTVVVEDDGNGNLVATATGAGNLVFENSYAIVVNGGATASLAVTKTLANRDMEEGEFEFTLTEVDGNGDTLAGGATQTKRNAAAGMQNGSATASIAFDAIEYDSVDDIGTHTYQIRETAGNAGGVTYDGTTIVATVEVTDNDDGTLSVSEPVYIVDGVVASTPSFQNSYAIVTPATANIVITKALANRVDPLAAGEFEFTLTEVDENGVAMGAALQAKTNDAAGAVAFDEITYDTPGNATHRYVIAESATGLADKGITPGAAINVVVDVVDDGTGTLTATVGYPQDGNGNDANVVTNTYGIDNEVALTVSGHKNLVLNGLAGPENATFAFTLAGAPADGVAAPMPAVTEATSDANGDVTFGDITFTRDNSLRNADGTYVAARTFEYTVTEQASGIPGVTDDATPTRTFTVTVADNGNGNLTATPSWTGNAFEFANTYAVGEVGSSPTGAGALNISKTLDGRAMVAGEFAFQLVENSADATTYDAVNAADGTVAFDAITFTEPGTYTYTLSEVVPSDAKGVTYDRSSYAVTATVTDNQRGGLEVAWSAKDSEGADVTDITFANRYASAGTLEAGAAATSLAQKTVTGESFDPVTFGFTLEGQNVSAELGNNSATLSFASGEGEVATKAIPFGSIAFTQADMVDGNGAYVTDKDLVYTVREAAGTVQGWTYDQVATSADGLAVTVRLTDDQAGHITATVVDGPATVTNAFEKDSTIVAEKVLTNRDAVEGGKFAVGDTATFDIVVTNAGNYTQENVTVGENLPNATILPYEGEGEVAYTVAGNVATIAQLAPNASVTVKAQYTVVQADVDNGVANVAIVESDDEDKTPEAEIPTVDKNPSMAFSKVAAAGVVVGQDGEAVVVDGEPVATTQTYSQVGDEISWDIVVANDGNVTLSDVVLTDNLANVRIVGADGSTYAGNVVEIGDMAPSETLVFTVYYIVEQADLDRGYVTNDADISYKTPDAAPEDEPETENQEATITGSQDRVLSIVKTAEQVAVADEAGQPVTDAQGNAVTQAKSYSAVGGVVNWTIVVANEGNVTLANVDVVDRLEGVTLTAVAGAAGSGNVAVDGRTAHIISLAPGASVVFNASYVVTQADIEAGSVANSAYAAGINPDDPANPPEGETPEIVVPADQNAELAVTKSADLESYDAAGQVITYSIIVTNRGNVAQHNVVVTDDLEGVELAAGPGTQAVIDNAAGTATIAELAPNGGTAFITATYTTTQADLDANRTIANVAAAVSDEHPESVTNDEPVETTPEQDAGLAVTKTADAATYAAAGDVITYTITVENTGNTTQQNIAVADPMEGVVFPNGNVIAQLEPGANAAVVATYTVTEADVAAARVIVNAASATSGNGTTDDTNEPAVTTLEGTPAPLPAGTPAPIAAAAVALGLAAAVPPAPGAAAAIADDANPLAEAIEDGLNPLAGLDDDGCWVHQYIILGILVTGLYAALVAIRRKKSGDVLQKMDDDMTGAEPAEATAPAIGSAQPAAI